MTRLVNIAKVIRSKNTSPFTLSLDIIFHNVEDYRAVKTRQGINADCIGRCYGIPASDVGNIIYFDPAKAIKICLQRPVPSGVPGDTDVYGAQQHVPLLALELEI